MKYVLILSLFYKHYKKSSTLKLFLDNRFIDEIVLDKNISHIPNVEQRFANIINGVATDVHKNSNWVLRRLNKITTAPLDPEIQLPNKIWLYHLNLDDSNKKISLNFEIHDNNYSNGFMTKLSAAKLHKVGIIPAELFENDTLLKRLCKELREKTRKKYGDNFESKPEADPGDRPDYPFVTQYENDWIGGSTCIDIPIVKKHRVLMLRCNNHSSYEPHPTFGQILVDPYFFWLKRQPALINTNKHEDKRNNYT